MAFVKVWDKNQEFPYKLLRIQRVSIHAGFKGV